MNRKQSKYMTIKRLVYHLGRKTNEMKSCYSVVMVENSNSSEMHLDPGLRTHLVAFGRLMVTLMKKLKLSIKLFKKRHI